MRKGNLVPLSLPAGGHRDLEWRINPAPLCPSGLPAISHAPGSWHPGEGAGGPESPQSSLLTLLGALILHGLGALLPGPLRPNPKPLLFSRAVNQPVRQETREVAGCREFLVDTNKELQQLRSEQTP